MSLGVTGPSAWAKKTAGEIRAVGGREGSILIVPVGSVEQHGNHLPVSTDSLLVSRVVEEALEAVDDLPLLTTPTVWTGHSPHHLPFGGTITLDAEEFLTVLEEVADSALENEFDALMFVNGHGGNEALISAATAAVGDAHPGSEVMGLTYFRLAGEEIAEIRESEPGGMAHGGEFETSLMRYFHPDLVDDEHMEGTVMDEPYDLASGDLIEGGPLSVYRPFTAYTESGAIGDPTLASAEKGEVFAAAVCGELAALLETVHERNR